MNENLTYKTYLEIHQQPLMWMKEWQNIFDNQESIKKFISAHHISKESEIILSGAGSSAFIGNTLSAFLIQQGYSHCKSLPTTELITHPEYFVSTNEKLVLVSFARSGNSPESVGVLKLANKLCKEIAHVIITCNKDGELAKNVNVKNTLLIQLPHEANDEGLAMTSSFTTMILAFLLFINVDQIDQQKLLLNEMSRSAKLVLESYEPLLHRIASRQFERAVFLGSGELKGIAEECQLKLQELTDGQVICKYDSFLGFRHGPKAVINEKTLLVYFFSKNEYVLQYEKDLVQQININNKGAGQIAVSEFKINLGGVNFDAEISLNNSNNETNVYDFISYVLIGQLLGFFKSLDFGLNPDQPSISGKISRVVEGVRIYDNYSVNL
jgi:tagatose-6-phosphate ketose/aldose isomerase